MSKLPLDPRIIGKAPLELEPYPAENLTELLDEAYEDIGYLANELAQTRAELQRLQEKSTVEQVKAELIKPYTNKVFWFVVWYCIVVGAILIADGIDGIGFTLKESTIGIIAGSTAVAVIGLIGMVISGLFGIRKSD